MVEACKFLNSGKHELYKSNAEQSVASITNSTAEKRLKHKE